MCIKILLSRDRLKWLLGVAILTWSLQDELDYILFAVTLDFLVCAELDFIAVLMIRFCSIFMVILS